MSYKTIAVHLTTANQEDKHLAVAQKLALKFGAHITGLYADFLAPDPFLYSYGEVYDFSSDFLEYRNKERRLSETYFTEQLGVSKLKGDWVLVDDYPLKGIAERARASDLLILRHFDHTAKVTHLEKHFAEAIMLSSGIPVLLVPQAGTSSTVGERILVAWNGSRESTRAVHDALPFLKAARQVTVIAAKTPPSVVIHDFCSGEEVVTALERHGVNADLDTVEDVANDEVADVLRSKVSDLDADLLVMGGYGHARAYETVLGGVTRSILSLTSVPVFLSH